MVYLTCSEPGVIMYSALVVNPFSDTCFAKLTARLISSYEELVQLPIKPTSIFVGHPFAKATSFILEIGVAKSGVKGPFKCGSKVFKSISITSSKYLVGSAYTSGSAVKCAATVSAKAATSARPVEDK